MAKAPTTQELLNYIASRQKDGVKPFQVRDEVNQFLPPTEHMSLVEFHGFWFAAKDMNKTGDE